MLLVCVWVCVCVCITEKQSETETETEIDLTKELGALHAPPVSPDSERVVCSSLCELSSYGTYIFVEIQPLQ